MAGDDSVVAVLERLGQKAPRIRLRPVPEEEAPPCVAEGPAGTSRYRVEGTIARGGVGVILRAVDIDLGRPVALKVIRRKHARTPELVRRFVEEAQITGQLQHPGVVPVHGLGLLGDGRPYFAMKLVTGRTLGALLKGRASPAAERRRFLAVFERICATMAYAHARGVVHRDLKPGNVMVGPFDEVQIVDWGFAKILARRPFPGEGSTADGVRVATARSAAEEDSDSSRGSVLGTPAYMAPEQAMGQSEMLDPRSDVFCLGAILCEILTGSPPYTPDGGDLLDQAIRAELGPAHDRLERCGADEELVVLVNRCLARRQEDRPSTAGVLAEWVSRYLNSVEQRAHQAALRRIEARAHAADAAARAKQARAEARQLRRARRQTTALASFLLLAVLGGGLAWFGARQGKTERARRVHAAVDGAIREANLHRGAGRWADAIDAARKAVDLSTTAAAEPPVAAQARSLLASVEMERRQADEDRGMAATLSRLRERWSDSDDHPRTDRDYAAAFRSYGIEVDAADAEEAGRRVAASDIATELTAALHDWALLRCSMSALAGTDWRGLFRIADAADPDEVRREAREAIVRGDVADLRRLAAAAQLPTPTVLLVAHGLVRAREAAEAVSLLKRAAARNPGDFWLQARLAYALGADRRWQDAIRSHAAALAMRPDVVQTYVKLGDAFIFVNQLEKAEAMYRRAIETDPYLLRAHIGLGLARMEKDPRRAADTFRAAAERWPEDGTCRYLLADALFRCGEHEGAFTEAREAVRLAPDRGPCHFLLGSNLFNLLRDYAGAAESFGNAARLDPADGATHFYLGQALLFAGELERAEEALAKAAKLRPEFPMAYLHLGRVFWLQGRFREAADSLRRAHRIGTASGNWPYRTPDYVARVEALGRLESDLDAYREGAREPADALERLRLAELCAIKCLPRAAARFYGDAFAAEPSTKANLDEEYLFAAACAAGRAGTGLGEDVADLDAQARLALRERALAWLREELELWRALADDERTRACVHATLLHWRNEPDIACLRGDALDGLEEPERARWEALWHEVDALILDTGPR